MGRTLIGLLRSMPMVVATLSVLAARSAPGSDAPPTSTAAKPAPAVNYSCNANAATGRVFTSDRTPEQPFSVLVPELPGWQRTDAPGTDISGLAIQRRDQLPGDFHSPTAMITVNPLAPTATAAVAVNMMRRTAQTTPGWHTRDDHPITVCGQDGGKVTGTFALAQVEWWEDHRLVTCACNGTIYPVLLVARANSPTWTASAPTSPPSSTTCRSRPEIEGAEAGRAGHAEAAGVTGLLRGW
ncbi:hypothetical protein ACQPW1_48035 [Nocardia sp. CA-128927]|uniref:hypothetical protein n=1 Tax=Nocardia sp. CA-128927 TaxID=3239975 RepID=UPI003D95363C